MLLVAGGIPTPQLESLLTYWQPSNGINHYADQSKFNNVKTDVLTFTHLLRFNDILFWTVLLLFENINFDFIILFKCAAIGLTGKQHLVVRLHHWHPYHPSTMWRGSAVLQVKQDEKHF